MLGESKNIRSSLPFAAARVDEEENVVLFAYQTIKFMPSENIIRKKAVKILADAGWIYWYPAKIKFKQNDIFGIIDLLALKGKRRKNIQLTTISNLSTRRKKIINFFKTFKVELPVEIWSWDKRKRKFRKEKINIKIKGA